MSSVPEWLRQRFNPDYPSWAKVEKSKHADGDIVNGCHMPSLKATSLTVGTADVYAFRFEEPFSWAIFTINDATGEFNIQSDWGNWQHRWNISSLGESYQKGGKPLTTFLARNNDAGYCTDKLHYDKKNDRDQFSEDETKEVIKQEILRARIYGMSCQSEEGDRPYYMNEPTEKLLAKWFGYEVTDHGYSKGDGLTKDQARELWDQFDKIDWNSADSFMQSLEYNTFGELDELKEFLSDDWYYDYVRTEPTFGFTLLQYVLLPFFFNYLRREVIQIDEKGKVA